MPRYETPKEYAEGFAGEMQCMRVHIAILNDLRQSMLDEFLHDDSPLWTVLSQEGQEEMMRMFVGMEEGFEHLRSDLDIFSTKLKAGPIPTM